MILSLKHAKNGEPTLKIKEIEFTNFKSFGKKVRIPFYGGFTAISGPNGSGKSNIIDGVLFALGLSGSRTMRAEKLTDLIYNPGDPKLKPDFAEVIITFDNTDRQAPVDSDSFTIARKVRQTKSGSYSYYYFNGRQVSQTDIHELLAKVGVTPEGYNVVMQGDVAQITARMSSTERRRIIDDIAGVSEFDEKKEKALGELDIVKDRIEKVDIIIEEVKDRLERLSGERETALKYQALRDEKKKFEGYLLLSKLRDARLELQNIDREISDFSAKKEKNDERIRALEEDIGKRTDALDRLSADIRLKGEDEQIRIRREIETVKGDISRAEEKIRLLESEESTYDSRRRELFLRIDSLKKESEEADGKLKEEKEREDVLLKEKSDRLSDRRSVEIRIARINEKYAEKAAVLAQMRKDADAVKEEKSALVLEEDRIYDSLRRKSDEIREIESEIRDAREKAANSQSDINAVLYEKEKFRSEADSLKKDIADLESAHQKKLNERKALDERRDRAEAEYTRLEARVRANDEGASYSHAVEDILKASQSGELAGICGTVADLGSVDNAYATALETAAGGKMQAIVVETDSDAAQAINYLRHRNKGRATFLPMTKMERRRQLREPDDLPGYIGYAVDLISCDPSYDAAFWYVFRDTVVIDTLENARLSIGHYRMVTLEGDILEKSGAMVGGSVSSKSRISFAASERERLETLKEEIRDIYRNRELLIRAADDISDKISIAEKRVSTLENEISRRDVVIGEIKGREGRLADVLAEKNGRIDGLKGESEQLRVRMNEVTGKKTDAEKRLADISDGIAKAEAELNDPETEELSAKASYLDNEIKRLESRLSDVKSDINSYEMQIGNLTEKSEDARNQIREIDDKKKTGRERISAFRLEIEENRKKVAADEEREKALSDELKELQDKRAFLEKEKNDVVLNLERAKNARAELDRREEACRLARRSLDDQVTSLSEEVRARGLEESDDVPAYQSVSMTIEALEKQMTALEPVNMRAISDYEEEEKRCSELTERRNTLFNEREELLSRIAEYEKMKRDAFMESYEAINKNFGEVFMELADGKGELILENPDDPFAGGMTLHAQPKGKKIIRLESMSGGEKSLTALAFIIAIQVYRPAPFYVFDEVDQNLDGRNVERVAERIRKSAPNAQFMVISLRSPMLERSDRIIGVTQQDGKTAVTGVKTR